MSASAEALLAMGQAHVLRLCLPLKPKLTLQAQVLQDSPPKTSTRLCTGKRKQQKVAVRVSII